MPLNASLKSAAGDLLAGFAALCLLIAFVVLYPRNDLRWFVLAAALLYFLAGTLRGASALQSSWARGMWIGAGGVAPVAVLRATEAALTEPGYPSLFIVFSLSMAITGVAARRLLSRRRRGAAALVVGISFAAAMLVVAAAIPRLMALWTTEQVSRPAPAFSFVTPGGASVASTELRGRVVVLALWAAWCVPCRQELPEIQSVYERYKGNSSVAFYALGGPSGDDTPQKEAALARQLGLGLPLAFDSQGSAQALGNGTLPAVIVLDRSGRIRMMHTGYDASENLAGRLSEKVDALLGE